MKKTKKNELAQKSVEELKKILANLRNDLNLLSVEKNAKRLKDVAVLGKKRKEVACVLTFINQKKEIAKI